MCSCLCNSVYTQGLQKKVHGGNHFICSIPKLPLLFFLLHNLTEYSKNPWGSRNTPTCYRNRDKHWPWWASWLSYCMQMVKKIQWLDFLEINKTCLYVCFTMITKSKGAFTCWLAHCHFWWQNGVLEIKVNEIQVLKTVFSLCGKTH